MKRWVWSAAAMTVACMPGPSEEQLSCYQGCAREKDSCMLAATNASQIQACDRRSAGCTAVCR